MSGTKIIHPYFLTGSGAHHTRIRLFRRDIRYTLHSYPPYHWPCFTAGPVFFIFNKPGKVQTNRMAGMQPDRTGGM